MMTDKWRDRLNKPSTVYTTTQTTTLGCMNAIRARGREPVDTKPLTIYPDTGLIFLSHPGREIYKECGPLPAEEHARLAEGLGYADADEMFEDHAWTNETGWKGYLVTLAEPGTPIDWNDR